MLTDKEWGEINAFIKKFPDAKHQLCFWHCLRAIKTHLLILHQAPAFYNVQEAKDEFHWIDEGFLPIGQMLPDTAVSFRISYGLSLILVFVLGQSSLHHYKCYPTSYDPSKQQSSALSHTTEGPTFQSHCSHYPWGCKL